MEISNGCPPASCTVIDASIALGAITVHSRTYSPANAGGKPAFYTPSGTTSVDVENSALYEYAMNVIAYSYFYGKVIAARNYTSSVIPGSNYINLTVKKKNYSK